MQYVVKFQGEEEEKEAYAWLEDHGYKVSSYLKDGSYPLGSVVIDWGVVFGASVTCLAAGAQGGTPIMTWEEWSRAKKEGSLYC